MHLDVKRLIYNHENVAFDVVIHISFVSLLYTIAGFHFYIVLSHLEEKLFLLSFGPDAELSSPSLSSRFYQTSRCEEGMVDCITAGET